MGTTLHLFCFHSLFSLPPTIAINCYQVCCCFCCIYFKIYILSETTLSSFYNQEHEKRCWSVDFNLMDPKLLASGSDDAKGTIWITFLSLPPPLFLLLSEIQILIEIYRNLLWLLIVPKITELQKSISLLKWKKKGYTTSSLLYFLDTCHMVTFL